MIHLLHSNDCGFRIWDCRISQHRLAHLYNSKSAIPNRRWAMATINLRNIPDDLHRKAKARAAMEGVSLKQLILRLLEEYLEGVC